MAKYEASLYLGVLVDTQQEVWQNIPFQIGEYPMRTVALFLSLTPPQVQMCCVQQLKFLDVQV